MRCGLQCLKINNLTVSAEGKKIVQGVSLHAHCGELTAIIGKNGSGKSTLVKGLLGELPSSGEIVFSGLDDQNGVSSVAQRPKIGYVPQQHSRDQNSPITVFDLLHTFNSKYPLFLPRRRKDILNVKKQLELFKADYLIDEMVGSLSGGELQKVLLANAMMSSPDLLVFDEPVSGVDESGLDVFYELLNNLKKTHGVILLIVSHDLDFVQSNADNVILLSDGKAISGTVNRIFNSAEFKKSFPKYV